MSNQTIDQLQKEIEDRKAAIAAEEEKLREIQREALRIEQEQKAEIEKQKRIETAKAHRAKYLKHAEAIVKALKLQGFTQATVMSETDSDDNFPIIGLSATDLRGTSVRFEYVHSGYGFRHTVSGVRVQVGASYEDGNKRFPQRKDGTFNYDGIAKTARELHDYKVAVETRRTQNAKNAKTNKERVANLTNTFGKLAYKGADYKNIKGVNIYYETSTGQGRDYHAIQRADNDLKLVVDHITEENAAKLLQFMKQNGMLKED